MKGSSMVRHYREEFDPGRVPPGRPHGRRPKPSAPWQRRLRRLWMVVAFAAVRALLSLAQIASLLAARLLRQRLLPLPPVRWMLRLSYALTRLSFRILRACVRRGIKR